jgi:hypothetical protein
MSGVATPAEVEARTYFEGHSEIAGDVHLSLRYFTAHLRVGMIAGSNLNATFTIERPPNEVWPYARDWNLWMRGGGFYLSGVVGDLEGQTFSLSDKPNDTEAPHFYRVDKVIPDYAMVVGQPVLNDEEIKSYGLPGYGGYSGGHGVYLLAGFDGQTIFTAAMEHASVMARPGEVLTAEEALAPLRGDDALDGLIRWREHFIPTLKRLVEQGPKR